MDKHISVEKSIIKKFRKSIWNRFIMGIKEYKMINEGDKIAVCISGGKDSVLLAKCIQYLQKYSETHFQVEYICMDPGYNKVNREKIEYNCKLLDIPVRIFESSIFNVVDKTEKSPCYLCARMRRGHLYKYAKELGCNKIALGHHYDDVIETIFMGMLYGGQLQTMMPKLHSTNFEGMELIRPIYMVREADIKNWVRYNSLEFIACACTLTEKESQAKDEHISKRAEIKELIADLKKVNPLIEYNIFNSVCNVNLSTIISYQKNGNQISFLDTYDNYKK